MQIILLEKVVNVGNLGDVVKVKQGFARNFLIPQGKAKRATPENIKLLEAKRAELEAAAAAKLARRAGAGGEARGHDRQRHAKGRRRRPPVRLGHERRHRRCAEGAGVRRREGGDPDAGGSAEAGRRSSAGRRRAFRRGVEHHRPRDRRNGRGQLIARASKAARERGRRRPFCFSLISRRRCQRNDSNCKRWDRPLPYPRS